MTIIWLIAAVALFIGEMVCPIFFMFWFGIGALVALLVSLITSNIIIQSTVFLLVSIILVIFMKPLTKKFFKTREKNDLNMDGIIGKNALVTKVINNLNGVGEVKVHGEVWSAINENDNEVIDIGKQVEILKVDGVKLVVKVID